MEYQKIPNIFKREEFGENKLIVGQYSSKELMYLKDNIWEFTEKVDGTNIRVIWDGYRVSFKGRTDKAEIPKHLHARLEELFSGETKEEIFEQTFGNKEVILFGEGFGEKIQKGEAYGKIDFILFDVFIDGYWLERANIEGIAEKFEIKIVPVIIYGTLPQAVALIESKPMSLLKGETLEGVVGRPIIQMFNRNGERIIVKIKCRDF